MHPELFASWADWMAFTTWAETATAKPPGSFVTLPELHPFRVIITEETDLFVGWLAEDWATLERRFNDQWEWCQAGEMDLLYCLAVKLAAEVGRRRMRADTA